MCDLNKNSNFNPKLHYQTYIIKPSESTTEDMTYLAEVCGHMVQQACLVRKPDYIR